MNTIKKSFISKNVVEYKVNRTMIHDYQPKAGDIAIFEVVSIGSLNAIQDDQGRNCHIFPGDKIMLTFGNRYATNQFEGYVPFGYHEEYHLIGKGGVAGIVESMASRLLLKGPTKLTLAGYAVDNRSAVLNTQYYNSDPIKFNRRKARDFKTILSLGSSMDSGKTTSAAYLCRGLKMAGYQVAYIKLTGTVFNKDKMLAYDCGADKVSDFAELGFPSTYLCSLDTLMDLYESLLYEVETAGPDYVVIEIADGLYQRETSMLLNHIPFTETVDHVFLSCCDSLAVHAGVEFLSPIFDDRLFAIGGLFTCSPLLIAEVEEQCELPVLSLEKMLENGLLKSLLTTTKVHIAV